ncbi:M23 family metallopeptidase [Brevundimonas sp. SGAir0440]|uniref:M23 family metallopeptidase n=1 Tax=Brevundimonas sp. SGAir0440 TaxID=2579977 RepID=UPI0010CD4F67|nr:M23 family metallopeptidase [Brevundimonas sp. SGAir0440]QCQ99120.1 M23 family metallopeptidase [Brevundimonas sp. SGAir0440]
MADLSRQSQRRTTQDRITNNRDAILPTRREDRVDPVRVNASMRDAQRGNNLDELRRFFGQAQDTAEAYFRNDIAQTAKRAEGEYAQGMTDALGGVEMDPAKAEATAYQRAYYSVTASNRQTKFETETTQGLDDLIQSGATVEEIETYMQERSSAFVGEVSDLFESPEVRLQVGQRMQRWSNDVNARASGVLQERTDREMLNMTTGEVQAALGRGEGIDLLGTVGRLKEAGLDGVAVQEEIVNAVVAYATQTGDLTGLYSLLDTRRPEDVAAEIEAARADANNAVIEGSPLPSVTAEPTPAPAAPAAPASTYIMPLEGRVTSGLGARRAPLRGASTDHGGIDIAVPIGTPVVAPADGVVEFAGPRGRGGNTVLIRHADGRVTGYAHLDSINVKAGDRVSQGATFAASGNTGNSTGPHLHFSARDAQGRRIDPRSIVGQPAQNATPDPSAPAVEMADAETPAQRRARAPGASVLTSAQQIRVLNAIEGVEADTERRTEKARVEAKDDLTIDLYNRSLRGENVDEAIQTAAANGVLEPGEAMTMRGAFRSLRNDVADGEADEDLTLRYASRFAVAEPNYASIGAQADRDYNAGRFGTGRNATRAYLAVKERVAAGSRQSASIPPEERRTATVARSYVGSALGELVGEAPPPDRRRLGADALIEWERRVAGGKAPMAAADEIIAEYTPRFTRRSTATADGNTRAPGATRAPGSTQTARAGGVTRVDRNGNIIQGD